jgi:hypothetical protein
MSQSLPSPPPAPGKVAPELFRHFLDLHEAQLTSLGVPRSLHESLYLKLSTQCFDSFERFGIEQDEEGNRQCECVSVCVSE